MIPLIGNKVASCQAAHCIAYQVGTSRSGLGLRSNRPMATEV